MILMSLSLLTWMMRLGREATQTAEIARRIRSTIVAFFGGGCKSMAFNLFGVVFVFLFRGVGY